MSYPTFPILTVGVVQMKASRGGTWPTVIQTAASQKEMRGQFSSTTLWNGEISVVARQIPWSNQVTGIDEVANLRNFWNQQQGPLLAFYFTDLQDGVQRLCRFDQDALEWERDPSSTTWWSTSLKLRQVLQ